jgi:hypothetical protein
VASADALEPVLAGIAEFLDALAAMSPAAQKRTLAFIAAQASAEERVRQDYTGRYPMELLQNAHDAAAEAGRPGEVRFHLSETALLVANEGVPFDEEHIDALVSLGLSEKQIVEGRRRTIGYKGIGFSSVFEITDSPQIIARDLAFSFDRERARDRVEAALGRRIDLVPVRAFPFRVSQNEWEADADLVERLFATGAITVVRLPLRHPSLVPQVAESLRQSLPPEALLFSPFVSSLTTAAPDWSKTWRRTSARPHGSGRIVFLEEESGERGGWLTAEGTIPLSAREAEALDDRLWIDVRELSYAVALPWRGGVLSDVRPHHLHVYYPTEDVLDRAVLVHGDFYVTSDRRRIATNGAGGRISERVAVAVAQALARLAEDLAASQGAQLLHALAPSGGADGFGNRMGEAIDEELSKAKIARTATGARRAPTALNVFDPRGLGAAAKTAFARMLGRQADLLQVGDADATTLPFLKRLGAEVLSGEAAADRIRHTSPADYAARSAALAEWLGLLDKGETHLVSRAVQALRRKPLLVDTAGKAVRPDQAVLRIADVPPLPLQRSEVKVPRVRGADELLQKLGVEELDLAAAVKLVLNALGGTFGRNTEEGNAVLAFLQAVWRRDRSLIETEPRIRNVPVPVRPASGRSVQWINGKDAYFASDWTGNDNLERVYGLFKEHEFLAVPLPKRGINQTRAFFRTLGVADLPISYRYKIDWSNYGPNNLADTWEWRQAADYTGNGACSDHPRSQTLRLDVVDRIDDIVQDEELSVRRATALAALLAETKVAYGPDATVTCSNSTHRKALTKKLVGYQAWLLRRSDWIPARNPGETTTSLRRPIAVWREVGRDYSSLRLPRAVLSRSVAEALDLPTPANPNSPALEYLLSELRRENPDLAEAEQAVRDTARWAQQQLDRLLRRTTEQRRLTFHLVAEVDGHYVWSKAPIVANAPGARAIPGLPIVVGRCGNLQRVFGLRTAREDLAISVAPASAVRAKPFLDDAIKAALLAFLDARVSDHDQVVVRLARLQERPAREVTLEISHEGKTFSFRRPAYVEITRDRRGAIRGGILHWCPTEEVNALTLGEELAFYLGETEQAESLALLLSNAVDVLDRYHITDQDLALAQAALRAATRRSHLADDDGEEVGEPEEPDAESEETAEGEDQEAASAESGSTETAAPRPTGDGATRPDADERRDGRAAGSQIRQAVQTFGRGRGEPAPSADGDGYVSPWRGAPVEFGEPVEASEPSGRAKRRRSQGETSETIGGWRPGTAGGGFIDADHEAEADAIEIVKHYAHEYGAVDVRDVQDQNRGWDLEFVMPDGRLIPVEVKGSRGNTAFMVTRNERKAASVSEYLLLWVANLRNPEHAVIRRFSRLSSELQDEHLVALSWIVEGWDALSYDEVPVRVQTPSRETV